MTTKPEFKVDIDNTLKARFAGRFEGSLSSSHGKRDDPLPSYTKLCRL